MTEEKLKSKDKKSQRHLVTSAAPRGALTSYNKMPFTGFLKLMKVIPKDIMI